MNVIVQFVMELIAYFAGFLSERFSANSTSNERAETVARAKSVAILVARTSYCLNPN